MINLELVEDYRECVNSFAGQLRAFRAAAMPLLLLSTLSCTKTDIFPVCPDDDCQATMYFPGPQDKNGYYHITLDWSQEYYPYFHVDIDASPTSEPYKYNGDSVVSAKFDSDTSWVIGDTLVMKQAYYKPFTGEWSSTAGALPTHWRNLNLTQFKGTVINIAQNTSIYFSKKQGSLTTRRTLGPFPPHMKGDTITVFMEVIWDAGDYSLKKSGYKEKFIVE